MGDKAILGDCLDYLRQNGFKLVTSILVADAMDYQIETNDVGSIDADAALKDQRIVLTGGPQSTGMVTSSTNLSWSAPSVMAADFATPQLMDKIRGRISTVPKVAVISGSGEINAAIVVPNGGKVPVWTRTVPFNATQSFDETVTTPKNIQQVLQKALVPGWSRQESFILDKPSLSGSTKVSATEPDGAAASVLLETSLTAKSGTLLVMTQAGADRDDDGPIELAASASLSGKIELYKRFSGEDKLLISISPNRTSRSEQDELSIIASDPEGRRLISVEKYDLRQLPDTGIIFDAIVTEPAVYTISISMTLDVVSSSTTSRSNDRSLNVKADLQPLGQQQPVVRPDQLR